MRSSGQLAYDQAAIVHCIACDHVDYLDVHIDPEVNEQTFVCALCCTPTTEEWRAR